MKSRLAVKSSYEQFSDAIWWARIAIVAAVIGLVAALLPG